MRAVVLRLLGELRNDDGRRGHGDGAPDRHGDRGDDIECHDGDRGHDAGGNQHLHTADADDFPTHRDQARQGKFQAQCKYQKYHAEIRQQPRRFVVDRQGECVRPERHSHREIA